MKFVKRQMGFSLYGVIFWLPIGIALIIGVYIFGDFESLGKGFLSSFLPERFVYPGLGIAFWLVLFFVTGLMLKRTNIGNFFGGIPFIGAFFRSGGTIIKLGNKSGEIIDILLYGLRRPEELIYLPWEDETEEEFKERGKHFGLDMEPSPLLQSALDKIEKTRRPR